MFIYTRFSTYVWILSFLVHHFKNVVFRLTLYFEKVKELQIKAR